MFSSVVLKIFQAVVSIDSRAVTHCTALNTHHSLKHFFTTTLLNI